MTKKEKTQLIALGATIAGVLLVLAWNYRESFLPKPIGSSQDFSAPSRTEANVQIDQAIFQRSDYVELEYFEPYDITLDEITPEPDGLSPGIPADDVVDREAADETEAGGRTSI